MSTVTPYYEHNGITIYHGDCREILPELEPVDLVLTDPPYNVALGTKSSRFSARQSGYLSHCDNMADNVYANFIKAVSNIIFNKSSTAIITSGNSNQSLWPMPTWTMAWTKSNGVTRTPLTRGKKMQHACWEPILVYGKLEHPMYSDVISCPISQQQGVSGHPCPKPLKLFRTLLAMTCGSIIDPFMGSGTTLVAAKELGRKAIGIEIEEKYCEIAVKRLAQEILPLAGGR